MVQFILGLIIKEICCLIVILTTTSVRRTCSTRLDQRAVSFTMLNAIGYDVYIHSDAEYTTQKKTAILHSAEQHVYVLVSILNYLEIYLEFVLRVFHPRCTSTSCITQKSLRFFLLFERLNAHSSRRNHVKDRCHPIKKKS